MLGKTKFKQLRGKLSNRANQIFSTIGCLNFNEEIKIRYKLSDSLKTKCFNFN